MSSTITTYREIFSALSKQYADPSYEIGDRAVPTGNGVPRRRPDVGDYIWAGSHGDGLTDLGAADSIRTGQARRVDIDDRTFALYRLGPDDYALTDGVCTHGQTHLADGLISDCVIECPKHNGRFDIRSGEPLRRPVKIPLGTYDVEVVDGRLVSDLVVRPGSEIK